MNIEKKKNKKNKGQVSLVVLLVAAIITTLGLSLSKKTVLETKIDIDDELQKQAFNTAESGIEYFLGTGTTTSLGKTEYQSSDGKSRAEVTIETIGNSTILDFNELTLAGKYQYFWLAGHDAEGELNYSSGYYSGSNVSVCATISTGSDYAGLASVNYFYREGGVFKVRREMINFSGASGGCMTVNLGEIPILLTVSPVGLSQVYFSLRGTVNFPGQGNQITAVGQAGDLAGEAVKSRVRTLDRYSILPFMLEPLSAMGSVGN